ncbi:MAG: DNA polymerase III subunit delta [Acholeplasmataceae bacterium]
MDEKVYLYYGPNLYLLNSHAMQKVETFGVDDINILDYDLADTPLEDVIEDLQTVSFFAEKKVIIVRSLELVAKAPEDLRVVWSQSLRKPNDDIYLVMIVSSLDLLDQELKKEVEKYAFIEKVEDMDDAKFIPYLRDLFNKDGYEVNDDALNILKERTKTDFQLMHQEIEKLKIYAYQSKQLTKKDILTLVSRNLEENMYELMSALLEKNTARLLEIYHDLLTRSEDPLRILNHLVNRIRELVHTQLLLEKGYSQDEIAAHFNYHKNRVYYLIKDAKSNSFRILENYLKKLAKVDYEIKSGKTDKKLALELFLLEVF